LSDVEADRFLSPAELAAFTGHTTGTLAQWRYKGIGPAYCKFGGKVRYRQSAVQKWAAEQEAATPRTNPAA
jgi:predicted DNA-binding transcriptional regulator AlpA